jgi:uncharacterized membrane-anchored protein YhcB (DUF1043 family)
MTKVIESLLIEVDGRTDKLRSELQRGEREVARFGQSVTNSSQTSARAADQVAGKYGSAARQIASATEQMARSGQVAGDAAKQVLATGAEIALGFGPQGAIVGAVGIATLAVIGLFQRTSAEAKKALAETKKALDDMQNRGDVSGLTSRARTVFEGTAANDFKDGIAGIRKQITDEQTRFDEAVRQRNVFVFNSARKNIEELKKKLAPLEKEFAEIQRRILAPGPALEQTRDAITTTAQGGAGVEAAAKKAAEAAADFGREVQRQLANLSATLVDNMEQDLRQLDQRFSAARAKLTAGQIADYQRLREALRAKIEETRREEAANRAAEASERALADGIERAGRVANEATRQIGDAVNDIAARGVTVAGVLRVPPEDLSALVQMARTLELIARNEALGNDERQAASTLLEKVKSLLDQIEGSAKKGVGAAADTTQKLGDALSGMAQGARALLDAASAADLLDAKLTNALNSSINLAESLPAALSGDPASIIASAAAVLNLGAQLFGTSEEEKQRQATDADNVRAISQLLQRAGDLVNASVSGRAIGGVQRALGAVDLARMSIRGVSAPLADSAKFDISPALAAAGVSQRDLEDTARTLGVTLDGTAGSFRRLAEAIAAADLKAFADSFAGQLAQLEVLQDVDNVTDPVARLKGFGGVLTGAQGSPFLAAVLKDLDLGSAEGRATARLRARDTLDIFRNGGLGADALGGLSPQEFLAATQRFIAEIDAIDEAAAAAADPLAQLSARLSDIASGARLAGTDALTTLRQTIDAYVQAFPELGEAFSGLLEGIDVETSAGVAQLRERLQGVYATLLEGGLTDAERETVQALLAILSGAESIAEAAEAAARQTEELAARRTLARAGQESQILDETTGEAFARSVRAYAEVFPEIAQLAAGLDLQSAEGIRAFDERIRALFGTIGEGEQFDPLRDALLQLESGADAAAAGITQAAQAIASAASIAAAARQDAQRLGLSDADAARLVGATFNDSGRTFSNGRRVVDELGQFDFSDAAQREAALAAARQRYGSASGSDKDFLGDYIDFLMGFPAAPAPGAAGGVSADGGNVRFADASERVFADVQTIQERTANRLVEIESAQLITQQRMEQHLAAIAGARQYGALVPPMTPGLATAAIAPRATGGATATGLRIEIDHLLRIAGETGPVAALLASRPDLERALQDVGSDVFKREVRRVLVELLYEDRQARGNITSVI